MDSLDKTAFMTTRPFKWMHEMLLSQAARAFEIWHKIEPPYDAMKKALLGGF